MAYVADSLTGKIARKYMAHYIDTAFNNAGSSPSWYRIGKDLEEYSIELNPDTETSKNILGESTLKHNGYEESASADPFYAEIGDALFEKLQSIVDERKTGGACLTQMLDVHLWETKTENGSDFVAYKQDCYCIPSSYGGDTSGYQIPFEIQPVGTRVKGSISISSSGVVTFTADT